MKNLVVANGWMKVWSVGCNEYEIAYRDNNYKPEKLNGEVRIFTGYEVSQRGGGRHFGMTN